MSDDDSEEPPVPRLVVEGGHVLGIVAALDSFKAQETIERLQGRVRVLEDELRRASEGIESAKLRLRSVGGRTGLPRWWSTVVEWAEKRAIEANHYGASLSERSTLHMSQVEIVMGDERFTVFAQAEDFLGVQYLLEEVKRLTALFVRVTGMTP